MKQIIQTTSDLQERCVHGTPDFPLQINHDSIEDFQDNYIRCHWHNEIEISIVVEGVVLYQVGGTSWRQETGQCLIINANTPHMMTPAGGNARILSIIVHPSLLYGTPGNSLELEILRPYLTSPKLAAVPVHPDMGDASVLDTFFQIDRICTEKPFAYQLRVRGLLCTAFSEIIRANRTLLYFEHPVNPLNLNRLQILLDYIHTHYDTPLSLSQLAAQIPFTRENCCRFFRQMTGCTISEYLTDYRISRSIHLLNATDYSISDIAARTGFSSPSRFASAFRAKTGLLPSEYRKNHPTVS